MSVYTRCFVLLAIAATAETARPEAPQPVRIVLPDFGAELRRFDAPVKEPVEWAKHVVNAGWGTGRGGRERRGGWIEKQFELVDYLDRSADYVSHRWLQNHGIWHEVYGSNEYQETIHFIEKGARDLFWDNGIARDMFGKRTLSQHFNTSHEWWKKRVGWDAFIACNNAPRWSAVINYDLLTSPLFGDAMSQDNIGGPTSRIGAGAHGRYCDFCNRKFFHYLRTTGHLPQFRSKYRHIREYVQDHLLDLLKTLPPNKTEDRYQPSEAARIRRICDDPVMAEYLKFLYMSHMHNMLRYYRDQKVVAKRLGKPYDVHGNMGGGFMGGNPYQVALADFVDTVWFESAAQSTYDLFMHKWHNAWGSFRFEIGRAMTRERKPLFCMAKFRKKTADLVAHELAEPCAGGGVLFVAQHTFAKQPELLKLLQDFFALRHNHRAIFGQHLMHRHCQVALLYSVPTLMYRNYMPAASPPPTCAMIGMARGLEDNHVPFDVAILNHPEFHDDLVSLPDLKRYKLLILPVIECLSDAQIEKIGRYLDTGGTVGLIGEVGTRDENNRPRAKSVGKEWKSRGRVIDLTPSPNFQPSRDSDPVVARRATDNAARRVKRALSEPIIDGEVPSTLWVKTWAHDCGVASFHFVNYDMDFESGKANPTPPVRLSVHLPRGILAEEAQFLVPGEDPRPIALSKARGRVNFELPPVRVYGLVLIGKKGLDYEASAAALGDALFARAKYACDQDWGTLSEEVKKVAALKGEPQAYATATRTLLHQIGKVQEAGTIDRISAMADASGAALALDFGGEKPNAPWRAVAVDTAYSAERGFGWVQGQDRTKPTPEEIYYALAARYHGGIPYSMKRSGRIVFWPYRKWPPAPVQYSLGCGSPRQFRIDLPNRLYEIRVVTHMPSWTQRNFLVSGMVTANGAVRLLDAALFKGGLVSRSFTLNVSRGKLDLEFGGPTGWAVSAIVVKPAAAAMHDPLADGAVRNWKISPRYPNPDWFPLGQTIAPPEKNPSRPDTAGWRALRTPAASIGVIDLGSNREAEIGDTVYAVARIDSEHARQATFHFGATSQAMAWLNGRRIAYLPNLKGLQRDEFLGPIQLRPGPNVLLLKLSRFWERRWMFYASINE